jgi:hypothetical protein
LSSSSNRSRRRRRRRRRLSRGRSWWANVHDARRPPPPRPWCTTRADDLNDGRVYATSAFLAPSPARHGAFSEEGGRAGRRSEGRRRRRRPPRPLERPAASFFPSRPGGRPPRGGGKIGPRRATNCQHADRTGTVIGNLTCVGPNNACLVGRVDGVEREESFLVLPLPSGGMTTLFGPHPSCQPEQPLVAPAFCAGRSSRVQRTDGATKNHGAKEGRRNKQHPTHMNRTRGKRWMDFWMFESPRWQNDV